MSECLFCGNKYLGWPCKGGGVIEPSIGVPFWFVFVLTVLQQQNNDWRKPRFGDFSLSTSFTANDTKQKKKQEKTLN